MSATPDVKSFERLFRFPKYGTIEGEDEKDTEN
jgi:hypothetical protein